MNNRQKQESKDDQTNNDKNLMKNNQTKKRFDVDCICRAFEEFNKDESFALDHYIAGYKELSK